MNQIKNTRPKVLITRKIFDEAVALVREHFDVEENRSDAPLSPAELVQRLSDKDGVITFLTDRIDEETLSHTPSLKIVCNIAVGYNNVDLDACVRRKVLVTNTPGVLDDTTADFTWALLLSAARRVVEADGYLRSLQWKGWGLTQFLGQDVHHKTIGICGLGRIGQRVARRARGFDMQVLYTDVAPVAPSIEETLGARFVEKKTLLSESDFVTLHLPLSSETMHYISRADLRSMKPNAILINASRGPVVDEGALAEALQENRIAGAGLDVYEGEPDVNPRLIQMKNVVLAPHIASASYQTRLQMALMATENLVAGLTGKCPPNLVNPEAMS